MSSIDVPLHKGGFGNTRRKDNWWVEPLLVFLGFGAFIVYSTWAALQNAHYEYGPYLSPFYSPLLFRTAPSWWPAFLPFSAAMLILWALGGSAVVHSGRAAQELFRRAQFPADSAKRASLLFVSGAGVYRDPGHRRVS